ncbi:MAG: ATP-binding cassette domain-containing protein, partial [Micrococcales bacterium]|nr:ATP-binding cassette domain-containing protein [Micrococcales bacterium]
VRIALPFASATVVLVGTSLILMTFSLPFALVLLACSVLAGIAMPLLAQSLSRRADEASVPARAELAQLVHAVTRSSTDIVAYGRVEDELTAVAAVDARLRKAEARAAWTRGLATGGQHVVMGLAVAAALVIGGHAVVSGALPGRDLAVLALVPLALHETFGDLTKAAQTMTHASAALRRIVELLNAPPVGVGDRVVDDAEAGDAGSGDGLQPAQGSQASSSPHDLDDHQVEQAAAVLGRFAPSYTQSLAIHEQARDRSLHRVPPAQTGVPPILAATQPVLSLDGLAIGWPDEALLVEGLDLTLAAGQTVAVTAPSGVGKTTLAATILGLIPARGGSMSVTPSVGYLAQDAHIFATTVAENVRVGNPRATDDEVAAALRSAGLSHLDPARVVGEDGTTISGGEARRVALARLLVVRPRPALTLLDEPTEHLDAETAGKLMDDIWATTLPAGALLVLTHDPGVVARCDREVKLEA